MNAKNTMPEAYCDNIGDDEQALSQDDILMNESDILSGLLALGKERDEERNYHKVQIKRNGILMIEFRIRPITEEESHSCWKMATRYAPTKPGQPKVAIETNQAKYRSMLIYTATVDVDRERVWNNRQAKDAFNVLDSVDMIDKVLKAGEKSRVLDIIDDLAGFEDDTEELAKN